MVTYQLSHEAIAHAAEMVIREQGEMALSEAAKQISALNSIGHYSLAATWQRIRFQIAEGWQLEA